MGICIPIFGYLQDFIFLGVSIFTMPTFWEERAANDLKAQIKRAGLTYAQMAMLLTEAGEATTEDLFNKKINRGTFRHFFYLQCVELIDSHMLKIRAERPESQWVSSGKSEA